MKEKSLLKVVSRRGGLHRSSEIKTPERMLSVLPLDDALWTATGVDIEYLSMDKRFLAYLDSDANGRILCGEARHAIRYLHDCLLDLKSAFDGTGSISLADLRSDTEAAQDLAAAIRRMRSVMRACLNTSETSGACLDGEEVPADEDGRAPISFSELERCRQILKDRPVSADGVVLPDATVDPELRYFLREIIRSVGGERHPSGALGVTIPEIEEFLEEARLRLEWLARADQESGILVLGRDTALAYACWEATRSQIADYFELDALLTIDPGLAIEVGKIPGEAYLRALATEPDKPAQAAAASRAAVPLAIPNGRGLLSLQEVRDPLAAKRVRKAFDFAFRLLPPDSSLFGQLRREDFESVDSSFNSYRAWLGEEQGKRLSHLDQEKLQLLISDRLADQARELVGERGAAALAADDIRTVERFLLFKRDMVRFLNNFVVFPYLHDPETTAAFEAGSFIADGRRFSFSVRVKDSTKHKVSANYSRMFVMYLDVFIGGKASYRVAVPVTSGSQGRLYRGKHGLFREPDGTERDAIIVDLLENPISTLETLGMPFRKAYKTVAARMEEVSRKAEERLAKTAADRTDAALAADFKQTDPANPGHIGNLPEEAGARVPKTVSSPAGIARSRGTVVQSGAFGGLLAGGSIAVAALGSSFAFISKTLSDMSGMAVLATLGALVAAILVPILVSALFKLAARDLAPLLEASGIAMNRSIRLSRNQARTFTVSPRRTLAKHRGRTPGEGGKHRDDPSGFAVRSPRSHAPDRSHHEGF